ncbi:NADP-dependent isocitrate dehydrogenase [Bernardetia sp. ABR2-2B]|uniref:NADP-dependent isocitrate dehydrogenase n=1 Tax=Bernardetia sp. ABR2-2B TaxID=3127472 RepID=UPI0030D44AA4
MNKKTLVTVAKGDGIGEEIMNATLSILEAAEARIDFEEVEIGEKVYKSGFSAGITPETWESLRKTKVFLKAPITTPQGGGFKSLNVTIRKTLGLYSNVRPCVSYNPYVQTKHPKMDTVIIRENEEDLYAGIEHQQTDEVTQCLKLITSVGTEKIIRYAFEYAKVYNRKKVTCFSKDNIMKITDGLFHKTFDRIGEEYPEIEKEHWIVDIGAAKLATKPEQFDVIVMPNLYGDILSDVAAEITGSVGLAGSANIGDDFAMFEAIHGSAPDIAGKGIANPSGLLLGAVQMLVYIGQGDIAEKVQNAWLKTIEDGIHTGDIYNEEISTKKVGTKEFGEAVIERLGQKPTTLKSVEYGKGKSININVEPTKIAKKELVGVDIFLHWNDPADATGKKRDANKIGDALSKAALDSDSNLELQMITNRGVKVYPNGFPETFCTDHWRCRFQTQNENAIDYKEVLKLMSKLNQEGFDIIKTENLCTFDGVRSYSLGQGQ